MRSRRLLGINLIIVWSMIISTSTSGVANNSSPVNDQTYTDNSISGRVTDNLGNGIAGVTITATQDLCVSATATMPILLVNGIGGSETITLASEDPNMLEIVLELEQRGYKEGCNLFFAHGTSPQKTQAENAVVIRDELCHYHKKFVDYYHTSPVFNIIGHSYGGLRSRAYLESDMYGAPCPIETDTNDIVKVDNLITIGTPHGGEVGDLPLAFLIGLMSVGSSIFGDQNNWPSLYELLPSTRLWQNLTSEQPKSVDYYVINGDARIQYDEFSLILKAMVNASSTTMLLASDMAVHQLSGFALELIPWKYPNLVSQGTIDIHGRCDDSDPQSIGGIGCSILGLNDLKSYLKPSEEFPQNTFEEYIWPILHSSTLKNKTMFENDFATIDDATHPANLSNSQTILSLASGEVTIGNIASAEISKGIISDSQKIQGSFEIYSGGINQVILSWPKQSLTLKLVDPLGHELLETDPGVIFLTTNLGLNWETIIHFEDMAVGTWTYEISADNLDREIPYYFALLFSTPVYLRGSLPQWQDNNTPVQLIAEVYADASQILSNTTIQVAITDPSGTETTLDMHDDGAHGDNSANDGIFGVIFSNTHQGGVYSVLLTANGISNLVPYVRNASGVFFIAPGTVDMEMSLSDRGVDQNHDNLYEWLEVTVPVSVNTLGTYTLSAELYSAEMYIGMAKVTGDWPVGEIDINLRFPAESIYQSERDGPYLVRNLILLDNSEITNLIQHEDPYYQTKEYLFQDFRPLTIRYLPFTSNKSLESQWSLNSNLGSIQQTPSYSTLTDSNGYYVFNGLPDGTYLVEPSQIGQSFAPVSQLVTVPPDISNINFTRLGGTAPGDRLLIPSSNFQMGCDPLHNGDYACYSDELPLHTVYLDTYYIDSTEVTNAEYAQCVSSGACTSPLYTSSYSRPAFYGNPDYANYPVLFVSWEQAGAYCSWKGGRLPTEAEWEKAARGSSDTRAFPWGDQSPNCSLANFWDYNGTGSYCIGDTSAVGSYTSGASPYGVLDMGGNVWEWVSDWYSSTYYSSSPGENPTGPISGTYKVLRGGSWGDNAYFLRVAIRMSANPLGQFSDVGFRCVSLVGQ